MDWELFVRDGINENPVFYIIAIMVNPVRSDSVHKQLFLLVAPLFLPDEPLIRAAVMECFKAMSVPLFLTTHDL